MEYILRFAYAPVLYILVPLLCIVIWLRVRRRSGVRYRYPLSSLLAQQGATSRHPRSKILFAVRFILLALLVVLIAKPQLVDSRSKITIEGIDIVLVMDVSGSMMVPHHSDDDRSRLDVAKQEAIRFIEKRTNDAIGVVIFGNDALSRCPLTVDKTILKNIIAELEIGIVDPEGTVLSKGIITAANRLKHSKSKSKIMVVLTDGEPSPNDADPLIASTIAKELGIKIYTIGIGDNQQVFFNHPVFGRVPVSTRLNRPLLESFARETGGVFFEAKKPEDMRRIYDTIDTLEKNTIEAPIFTRYIDWFIPLVWCALALVCSELILTTFIWFGV